MMLFLLAVCLFPVAIQGYGEPQADGHPVYYERANLVLTNLVRMDPATYKSIYMNNYKPSVSGILNNYKIAVPLYFEPKLLQAALSHSQDMATSNCFSHDNCNGTKWGDRMKYFYDCGGGYSENIAAGVLDPIGLQNLWLCDKTDAGVCADDNSGPAGHRNNIMGEGTRSMGNGYAYSASSTYKHYSTQDFGGRNCAPAPTSPVHSGSHFISGKTYKFVATYYVKNGTAPSSAIVNVDSKEYNLTLEVGTDAAGGYAYSFANFTAGCLKYYFEFKDVNGTHRHPDTGSLITFDGSVCKDSYAAPPGSGGSDDGSSASALQASILLVLSLVAMLM